MKLAIVGAGAIGGTIGAYLIRGGHDVTFIDLAPDHVTAIQETGLRIEGPIDTFTVQAEAYHPHDVRDTFKTILLCVKAHATASATNLLGTILADDGYVVSVQNGLNELVIASEVGSERTIGCFVNFGADYLSPGIIHYGGRGAFVLGELDGRHTSRLKALHQTILDFEPNAITSPNIWGYLWAKLAVGSMIFATALTNDSIADCYANPDYRDLFIAIAREVLAVARKKGINPEPFDGFDPTAFYPGVPSTVTKASLEKMVDFNRRSTKTHSGVWRDLSVRKRKTEAEAQLGPIIAAGNQLGLETPLVIRILEMIREVEQGQRNCSANNLAELNRIEREVL